MLLSGSTTPVRRLLNPNSRYILISKHGAAVKSISRYRIMTALFLGILGYVPLWGQNIDFTPDRPDGPAKIQSALWELATPGAAKPTRDGQDTVVVILVPQLGQASASIDTSSLAALGGTGSGAVQESDAGFGSSVVSAGDFGFGSSVVSAGDFGTTGGSLCPQAVSATFPSDDQRGGIPHRRIGESFGGCERTRGQGSHY